MKLVPKKVRSATGMNPVARAVAQNILRQAIVDQKIQLYLMQDGDPCADTCFMIAQMLSVLIEAAMLDKTVGADHADVRVMRGTISACDQMIKTDRFSRINIVSLEKGLDAAYAMNSRVSPRTFNKVWNAKPRVVG
jgi:hypothetical protein